MSMACQVQNLRSSQAGDATVKRNLTVNGVVSELSSRDSKTNIVPIEPSIMLAKVMSVPISEWSYIDGDNIRHIGPMAHDFHNTFNLGSSDKTISTMDTGGVALAAIQAVKTEKDVEIKNIRLENQQLKQDITELRALVDSLVEIVSARPAILELGH